VLLGWKVSLGYSEKDVRGDVQGGRVIMRETFPTYCVRSGSGTPTELARAIREVAFAVGNGAHTNDPGEASLIILHDNETLALPAEVLRFYHDGLGGEPKRLIYITRPPATEAARDDPAWLFRAYNSNDVVPELVEWLNTRSDHLGRGPEPPDLNKCRALVAKALGVHTDELRREFAEWSSFFDANNPADFYHSLCTICPSYVTHSHARIYTYPSERPPGDAPEASTVLKRQRRWRFQQVCGDLQRSLAIRLRPESDDRNMVILIDDNPDEYLDDLEDLFKTVLPELELWICRLDARQKDAIRFISQYRSGEQSGGQVKKVLSRVSVSRVYPKGAGQASLFVALPKARFILMDQLFRLDSRFGELQGPALTRGVSRILRDELKAPATSKAQDTSSLPEIIAISRDEDPEVIQHALRAGAKDYVFKSQLLALPCVLAKAQRAVSYRPRNTHRNFRGLYTLPSETVGLLHTIRIPRVAMHEGREEESSPSGRELTVRRRVADLLTILPKPDLHVHLGSCMSTEFLVVASIVGLLRHTWEDVQDHGGLTRVVSVLQSLLAGNSKLFLSASLSPSTKEPKELFVNAAPQRWKQNLATQVRGHIEQELAEGGTRAQYQEFRAILHSDLGIRDFLSIEAVKEKLMLKSSLDLAFFAVRHSLGIDDPWETEDLIRIYLLVLATRYEDEKHPGPALQLEGHNFLDFFRPGVQPERWEPSKIAWNGANETFYSKLPEGFTIQKLKRLGWRCHAEKLDLTLQWPTSEEACDYAAREIKFGEKPIEYELASGPRCENKSLREYLEGCEFSGAPHLRHPFLIHLYAQQAVLDFVRKGVFYVELKGSPDGFIAEKLGFEFPDVCACLVQAFSQAQALVLKSYRECHGSNSEAGNGWVAGILGERYRYDRLAEMFSGQSISAANSTRRRDRLLAGHQLPCKVSLVFVGKRHKSRNELTLEAAAAAVMRPTGEVPTASARDFVENEMCRCRVVGFDLAGQEDGYPPESFAQEFVRLSRLHIPLTIHAGENAPSRFIEDAVLLLHARRIGHGLALAEDKRLMTRVREDRICIELCPVCNHQTSHFAPAESTDGRHYPLKLFLERGLHVSINTDNPSISNTNLVKEYFQASYAYDKKGLSLWDALRVIRMGYTCSFLLLPERRAAIQMVEQYLVDLFSDEAVVDYLRELA